MTAMVIGAVIALNVGFVVGWAVRSRLLRNARRAKDEEGSKR